MSKTPTAGQAGGEHNGEPSFAPPFLLLSADQLDSRTPDTYWIGGSPCSGKSTIAALLSHHLGLSVYSCDDAFYRHSALVTAREQPVFHRLVTATCDEIWMRPVEQQIDEERELYREEFPLILNDLRNAGERPVVAEGAALLPEMLAQIGIQHDRAIWLVPTEEFQRGAYAKREWRHTILAGCRDPGAAWDNWMERDAGFALAVSEEARERGYMVITIDGERSVDVVFREVRRHFAL